MCNTRRNLYRAFMSKKSKPTPSRHEQDIDPLEQSSATSQCQGDIDSCSSYYDTSATSETLSSEQNYESYDYL